MCSWNLRGKPLEAIQDAWAAWDVLDTQGVDFLFLQELRGSRGCCTAVGSTESEIWDADVFSVCRQPRVFLPLASGLYSISPVELLQAGLLAVIEGQEVRMYLASLHLPYVERENCLQVWECAREELDDRLSALRYHDVVWIGTDLNMEVFDDHQQDERHVHLQDLLLNHALSISHHESQRGSIHVGLRRHWITFLYRAPQARLVVEKVMSGPEMLVGSDHKRIWGDMASLNAGCRIRRQAWTHKCGKWQVERCGAAFMQAWNSMAENAERIWNQCNRSSN